MISLIEQLNIIITVPILLFIGYAVARIWNKQEALYKQQISMLKAELDSTQLKFTEKLEAADSRVEGLKKQLHNTSEALKLTALSLGPSENIDERHLRAIRHEIRQNTAWTNNLASKCLSLVSSFPQNRQSEKLKLSMREIINVGNDTCNKLDIIRTLYDKDRNSV